MCSYLCASVRTSFVLPYWPFVELSNLLCLNQHKKQFSQNHLENQVVVVVAVVVVGAVVVTAVVD